MTTASAIRTVDTHPRDRVIGSVWHGWNGQFYYCDSHDPAWGYWMTNVLDASDRRNISERAVGRTFHNSRIQQWPVTDLDARNEHFLVDLDAAGAAFRPRSVAFAEACAADRRKVVFVDLGAAQRFARLLAEAAVAALGLNAAPAAPG